MAVRLEAVTFDVADATVTAAFWAGLLDRELRTEPDSVLVPGNQTQVGLRFVTSDTVQVDPRQLHLHLTSSDVDHQQRTIETALRLGGRHLDVGQEPDAEYVVLADPASNELCVIDPGNNWMAGTGYLGEVTCDGARDVGLFWHNALDWPLVLDENGQTAVQSPLGGTKISWDSWEGEPSQSKTARNRQRFDLVTPDPNGEAERLVSLGATRLADQGGHVEMADPGGNEFGLRAG